MYAHFLNTVARILKTDGSFPRQDAKKLKWYASFLFTDVKILIADRIFLNADRRILKYCARILNTDGYFLNYGINRKELS